MKRVKEHKYLKEIILISGVALLPFVDETRLWKALATVYPDLTSEESKFFYIPMNCMIQLHASQADSVNSFPHNTDL